MYRKRSHIAAPATAVYAWHARRGAFQRLRPPWQPMRDVRLIEGATGKDASDDPLREGVRARFQLRQGPLWLTWIAEHRDVRDGHGFDDVQMKGPFARWHHRHRFEEATKDGSWLEDHIEYALPLGVIGRLLGGRKVRRDLARTFRYRHQVTKQDFAQRTAAGPRRRPMRILITGSTGFVGRELVPFLQTAGHSITRLVRGEARAGELRWDPSAEVMDPTPLEGFDAVIHLAGEGIASGRWTAAKKQRILHSRVVGTGLLARTLAALEHPPAVLISASAVGIYGSRGDEPLDERARLGDDFLAEVCQAWEAAAEPARTAGIRVVHPRFGVILHPSGGALGRMLTPFRFGLGGRIGPGTQWMSWVAMDDVLGALAHALDHEQVAGPMNVVAPEDVTNLAFTKTLGRVLGRWTILPMPAFAARLVFGEVADALLLASQRAQPGLLEKTGYAFREPTLESTLRHVLGRKPESATEIPA